MPLQPIKLLIFDLDGTLIDSAPDIANAVNHLLRERGLMPLENAIIRQAIGEGFRKLIWDLFPAEHKESHLLDELEARLMHYYEKHMLDTTKPYAGVEDFLSTTDKKIALVTNKPIQLTEKTLMALKLDRFPWVRVFGGNSLPKKKPDPLPLTEVMKAAGVLPEETLMIGDGVPDMLAAKEAGVRAVACEFGYTPIERLRELGAKATFANYPSLAQVIANL